MRNGSCVNSHRWGFLRPGKGVNAGRWRSDSTDYVFTVEGSATQSHRTGPPAILHSRAVSLYEVKHCQSGCKCRRPGVEAPRSVMNKRPTGRPRKGREGPTYSFIDYLKAMAGQPGFRLLLICVAGQALLVLRNGLDRFLLISLVVLPAVLAIGYLKFRRRGPQMFDGTD